MSPKYIQFFGFCWLASMLICMVLEGTYFSSYEQSVLNDLIGLQALKVGGIVAIPAWIVTFVRGLIRLLVFDYSFYTGGFAILRYFWIATLSIGAVWGLGQTFAPVFANLLRLFR